MTAPVQSHVPPGPSPVPHLPRSILVSQPGRGELFARVTDGPNGPLPVVLLHGWQATADLNFWPLYPALADQRRLLAPDARAHGRGPLTDQPFQLEDCADDAVALLDHLGIDRAVVLGYSMGGAVAQLVADRHPDRIAGLVVASSALRFGDGMLKRLAIRNGGWQASIQRLSLGRHVGHRIVDRAAKANPDAEPLRAWLVGELERGHSGGLRAAGRALAKFDGKPLAERTRQRRLPTAFVLTTADRLCPVPLQREAAAALGALVFEVPADHDAPLAMAAPWVTAATAAIDHVAAG